MFKVTIKTPERRHWVAGCRVVALEKKRQFRKDFFYNFKILEHPFLSEHFQNVSISSVVRQQVVDCICATLLKKNSTTYVFLTIFQSFLAQLFQNIFMRSSVTELSRVLGCRLQSCLVLKSDSTRDNFLKLLEVELSPQKSLGWIPILVATSNIYKKRLARRRCLSGYYEKYHIKTTQYGLQFQ